MVENTSAFPLVEPNAACSVTPGMTLRDWFAGQLAAAEVASAGANYQAARALAEAAEAHGQTISQRITFNAYEVADALLAERQKGGDA